MLPLTRRQREADHQVQGHDGDEGWEVLLMSNPESRSEFINNLLGRVDVLVPHKPIRALVVAPSVDAPAVVTAFHNHRPTGPEPNRWFLGWSPPTEAQRQGLCDMHQGHARRCSLRRLIDGPIARQS